mgnify:CR=1 FL=1
MSKLIKRGAMLPVLLFILSVVWTFLGHDLPAVLLGGVLVSALVYFAFYVVENSLGYFVIRRVLEAIFTLFVISSLTFLLLRTIPGGPFDEEKALPPANRFPQHR